MCWGHGRCCERTCAMMVRAVLRLPAISSTRAYAIQPCAFLGLDVTMLFISVRARFTSLTSVAELTCTRMS